MDIKEYYAEVIAQSFEENGVKIDLETASAVAKDIVLAIECERESFSPVPPNPMIEEIKQKDRKIKEMESSFLQEKDRIIRDKSQLLTTKVVSLLVGNY